MSKEQSLPSEFKQDRVTRQLWETTRFIKNASRLSTDAFLAVHNNNNAIADAFPGSVTHVLNGDAVPVMICAKDEMAGNKIGITLLALSRQKDITLQPVVIDNGSTDGTGDFAKQLGAVVITEQNKGIMNALRKGFRYFSKHNHQGPLLYTDADSAPLDQWAATMVRHAHATIPNGGEAFGPVFYYDPDEKLYSGKNSVLTAGAAVRDLRGRIQGMPTARGPNRIIMADANGEILQMLSTLEDPAVINIADIFIRDAISDFGTIASCNDRHGTVVISGRRYPAMLDVVKRSIRPKQTRDRLYKNWK